MKLEIEPNFSPSKIVCVGRNYADHAAELGNEVPKEPMLFLKAPSSLLLPKQSAEFGVRSAESEESENHETHATSWPAIVIPPQSQQVEHEGELAVIIGKTCKNLGDSDDVNQYVRGFTCVNDVTARDLQKKDGQFARAKSFDTFCPIGPHIETELDVTDIRVVTRVNGEIRQDGRTSQMVFGVEFLIRYISNMMTLLPGDVIATGTPSGVSRMNSGDVCEVEIEGIGTLRNEVSNG
jgi:2-keto-4-pentenoate hydratase/2-oxohepta-3-ene-1,7-dioic acid hydratase in catechol pathway